MHLPACVGDGHPFSQAREEPDAGSTARAEADNEDPVGDAGGFVYLKSHPCSIASFSPLPQLERAHGDEPQYHRYDPEPHHDLFLIPAFQLEVVVYGRHPEYPFSPST